MIIYIAEKLIEESSRLAGHHKEMMQHNVVLSNLCHNFDEVQGRLERVAAVKPGCTLLNH